VKRTVKKERESEERYKRNHYCYTCCDASIKKVKQMKED
jgi:hypothetical protein